MAFYDYMNNQNKRSVSVAQDEDKLDKKGCQLCASEKDAQAGECKWCAKDALVKELVGEEETVSPNGEVEGTVIAVKDEDKFDEEKHPRKDKGEGGGRFRTKPETIEKQDDLLSDNPKKKLGYRDLRDALADSVTEDGTYNLFSGKPIEYKEGYQVSFQEETTEREGHAAYIDDDEYDRKVEALRKELGVDPDLGRFGEPEISFHVDSREKAMELARRFNQESVYDWSTHGDTYECIANPDFVGRTHYADRNNHTGKNYRAKQ